MPTSAKPRPGHSEDYFLDPKSHRFFSNDRQWMWEPTAHRTENGIMFPGDWVATPPEWTPGQVSPTQNQNAVNQERTVDSMLHTVAVTTKPVVSAGNQTVEPEKVIVAPEAVMAPDSHTAALTVGIKHAKDFDNVDMSLVQVHIKAGI